MSSVSDFAVFCLSLVHVCLDTSELDPFQAKYLHMTTWKQTYMLLLMTSSSTHQETTTSYNFLYQQILGNRYFFSSKSFIYFYEITLN